MQREEIERALLAQAHQISTTESRLAELSNLANDLTSQMSSQASDLSSLDRTTAALFARLGIDRSVQDATKTPSAVSLTQNEREAISRSLPDFKPIETPEFHTWEQYSLAVEQYGLANALDFERDPISQLLTSEAILQVEREFNVNFGSIKWTKHDFAIVGVSVLAAFLLDFFVVAIPESGEFLGKSYKGSPTTKWLMQKSAEINSAKAGDGATHWIRNLTESAKKFADVPYDLSVNRTDGPLSVSGLNPRLHRLMTPGHDPILGFVIGTLDIMRAQMTVIDDLGCLKVLDRTLDGKLFLEGIQNVTFEQTFNPLEALLKVFCHLLTDVFTPAGLPVPFFPILQSLKMQSPFVLGKSGEQVTFTHAARYMYKHGYNLQHFLTMSLVPGSIEMIIRGYYLLSNFETLYDSERLVQRDAKLCSMLLMAHSLSSASNLVKVWMYGMNPCAINWAELMALVRSFFAFVRAQKERESAIEETLTDNWKLLYASAALG